MKKHPSAALLILIIIAVTFGGVVDVAVANPYMASGTYDGEPTLPSINVQSPSEKLQYWVGSDVWLDFTVSVPVTSWYSTETNEAKSGSYGNITKVTFCIDGSSQKDATKVSEHEGVDWYLAYSVNLGLLTAGQHTIAITAVGSGYFGPITLVEDMHLGSNYSFRDQLKSKTVSNSKSLTITVDADKPTTSPSITLLSPANKTYYYTDNFFPVPRVRFTYQSDDTHLSVGYSFDSDTNITPVTNETTITLPIESRSLTLYANDSLGNPAKPQTVYYDIQLFSESAPSDRFQGRPQNLTMPQGNISYPVSSPMAQPKSETIWLVVAGGLVVIACAAATVVYFKRHKGAVADLPPS